MSRRDLLRAFAGQEGFAVTEGSDVVAAVGVPCLLVDETVGFCTIEKSFDAASGQPTKVIGRAVHGVRVTLDAARDGLVYKADGEPIGNHLGGDGEKWSEISMKKGSSAHPEDDASAYDVVHRYAKQIVGAVSAAGYSETAFLARRGPFKIPNTFEARAAVGPVQERIRDQRIAVIGLGGSGAFVLDLMVKTPVAEIYLLDPDDVDWHNFMRAPGAPTCTEIEAQRKERPRKVDYYRAKYASLREGIHAHAVGVESPAMFAEFVAVHPVDFAFVSIDQKEDCEWPRQDAVYEALSEAGIPFIDSGVSITVEDRTVTGAVTTSAYGAGSATWKEGIPNAKMEGNAPGYRNVQLPEVNALAAALAVMEWRRQTGQYASNPTSFLHKFRLESAEVRRP